MKPGSYNTQKLAAEAAAMEARLTALKLQLQKDRAKRQAAAAAATGAGEPAATDPNLQRICSPVNAHTLRTAGNTRRSQDSKDGTPTFWSHGKQGPLRRATGFGKPTAEPKQPCHTGTPPRTPHDPNTIKCSLIKDDSDSSKQLDRVTKSSQRTRSVVTSVRSDRSNSQQLSSQPWPAAAPPYDPSSSRSSTARIRPASCSSNSSSDGLDIISNDTSAAVLGARRKWLQQLRQGNSEVCTLSTIPPDFLKEDDSGDDICTAQSGQLASASRSGDNTKLDSGDVMQRGCFVKEEHGSLLHGSYDEAAAARGFQEALQEWRKAAASEARVNGSSASKGSSKSDDSCSPSLGAGAARHENVLYQQHNPEGGKSLYGSRITTTTTSATITTTTTTTSTTATTAAPSMGVQHNPFLNNSSVAAFLQRLSGPTPSQSTAGLPIAALHNQGPSSVVQTGVSHKELETRTAPVEVMRETSDGDSHVVIHGYHGSTSDAETPAQTAHAALDAQPEAFGCSPSMDTEHPVCCQTDADCQDQQHVVPFEDWLQSAEEQAAAAAAFCGSMFGSKAGITGAKPRTPAGTSQYHRQLESMLQAVEQFESQLSQKPCLLSHRC